MTSLHTKFAAQPAVFFSKLLKLEKNGRYAEALSLTEDIWQDFSVFPDVADFSPENAAEILLRCGSLLGFWGHNQQIADSQQNSKNILTEARDRFLRFNDFEKAAECENYLALAYWRTGEFQEAETWLAESLSHDLTESNRTKIYSHLIKSLILLSHQKYSTVIEYCKDFEASFRAYGDAFLNGSFCTNLGVSYYHLENKSEALKYFELAQFFHEKSQHKVYLGTVENNLAELYASESRFVKAHSTIDNAVKLFKSVKDKTREGFALDTKAQILFAERKFAEALQIIEKAVDILNQSENAGYLIETLMTKCKILVYLNNFSAAVFCLFDAVKIAQQQCSEAAAQKLTENFESFLRERDESAAERISESKADEKENIELILPPKLAHFSDIQCVRINNSHLEKIGLQKGLMAVVAKEEVKRGDLAVIVETENGAISCGFYDSDFGIVCLEGIVGEPRLFAENDVQILGKIIGVCDAEKSSDGKIHVKPIKF